MNPKAASPTLRVVASVVVLVVVLWLLSLLIPSSSRKVEEPAPANFDTAAAPSANTAPGLTPADPGAPVSEDGAPPPAPAPRMLALSLQFKGGRLVETARKEHAGTVRAMRGMAGQRGLYHRIVDPSGKVLFENLVADPSRMYYDSSEDGKTLTGGEVTLPDMPLQLRLPSGIQGRLEVYRMPAGDWTPARLEAQQNLVGTFDL